MLVFPDIPKKRHILSHHEKFKVTDFTELMQKLPDLNIKDSDMKRRGNEYATLSTAKRNKSPSNLQEYDYWVHICVYKTRIDDISQFNLEKQNFEFNFIWYNKIWID